MTETTQPEKRPGTSVDVIINIRSGTGGSREQGEQVAEIFRASGVEARVLFAKTGAEVIKLAKRAVGSDASIVVAGGGDGTISAVASLLVNTDKMLGVLPLGTLNHFAKDLRIPLDIEGALQTIIAGHSVPIDVGEVNGRIFINNSSLGLYPSIVRHRQRNQRLGYRKWSAFMWAALTVLRRYPFLEVRLRTDGNEFTRKTPFVFVGNNEYEMESFELGSRRRLDAGCLSVYATHRTGRLGLLRLAFRALFRRLRESEDFLEMKTEEVWIETRRKRLRVSTDGEIALVELPLHYRVRPHSLRVLVPHQNTANGG